MPRQSHTRGWGSRASRLAVFALVSQLLTGCYIFNFFKKSSSDDEGGEGVFTGAVIGQPLGDRAGGLDEAALAAVYQATTSHAPAALRPDPDLFVRRLLLEYRSEGATVARQIGEVEQFRLLLGGASEDFSKAPQDAYDATSLLAVHKVAEDICRGLVAPNPWEHDGWRSILPHGAGEEEANVAWLAQRIIGKPSDKIGADKLSALLAIMHAEEPFLAPADGGGNAYIKYVPVCATLALDAESLLY